MWLTCDNTKLAEQLIGWLTEFRFYVPLDTKYVILETFPKPISWLGIKKTKPKANDTLESFLSKVAFECDFQKKTCTYVMKTFAIFLLSK